VTAWVFERLSLYYR